MTASPRGREASIRKAPAERAVLPFREPAVGLRPSSLSSLLARSHGPALLVGSGGLVLQANEAARAFFRQPLPGADLDRQDDRTVLVRSLLGLGWPQLLATAREGGADLLLQLPAGASSPAASKGTRLSLEPVLDSSGNVIGLLVLLGSVSGRSRSLSQEGRARSGAGAEDPFSEIFGLDERLRRGIELARRFAVTSLPILLLAKTGTGKDLLARAIHRASPRAGGPFVAINCGGLSPHLLESELFGYAPGAFTGARREGREGKVGAADGGTLFLDEVAEMPRALQAILLRFLEDGTFYRVGDNNPRHADVRLVCATCRDLPRLVAEGVFRQDLFYRIKGACITMPSLRQREDVVELSRFLLAAIRRQAGEPAERTLSDEALEWIRGHDWPGNVRELKNALRHAVALADGEIHLEHLPVDDLALDGLSLQGLPSAGSSSQETGPMAAEGQAPGRGGRSLKEAEGEALRVALEEADGNLAAAARTLGVARSTLYRLMERHGIERT